VPILKGKSHCPAQFGRKAGILSEPVSGFIFANRVPPGNPRNPSYVLPLLDQVQHALALVTSPHRLRVHTKVFSLINTFANYEKLKAGCKA
jgi:hypothetical protein